MPVLKPGGGDNGKGVKASNKVKVDYTLIVPKGTVVEIKYEE